MKTDNFGLNIVEQSEFSKEPKPLVDWQTNVTDNFKILDREVTNKFDTTNQNLNKYARTQVVTTTGTDLNDYVEEGTYFFGASVTPTNIPVGVNGFLEVISADIFVKQIWYRAGTINNNDYMTYVRTMNTENGTWSDWQQLQMVDKIGQLKLLWSGECAVGETVTANESFANFRFILFRANSGITYIVAPNVYSKTKSIRGTNSYTQAGVGVGIELMSCRGTVSNNTDFKLDAICSLTITPTEVKANSTTDKIIEIWGIR